MEVSEDSRSSDDQSKPSLNQEDQELFAKQDSDANLKAEVSDINMDENQCFQSALDTEGLVKKIKERGKKRFFNILVVSYSRKMWMMKTWVIKKQAREDQDLPV